MQRRGFASVAISWADAHSCVHAPRDERCAKISGVVDASRLRLSASLAGEALTFRRLAEAFACIRQEEGFGAVSSIGGSRLNACGRQ